MIYLQAIILIDDPIIKRVETVQQNNEHMMMGLIIERTTMPALIKIFNHIGFS